MDHGSNSFVIQELYNDLTRKYRTHRSLVETAWRSFDSHQRARCIRAGAEDGVVLEHSSDTSRGEGYIFFPEWNLADISGPNTDFLLDMLEYRATKSLYQQYREGVNGTAGDREVIEKISQELTLPFRDSLKNCYTFFREEEGLYGESFKVAPDKVDVVALEAAIQEGDCIPQHLGELVLRRQVTLLQCLKIVIDNILKEESKQSHLSKPPNDVSTAPLSKSFVQEQSLKPTLTEVIANARDQKSSFEDYLSLLRTEPTVLHPIVTGQFSGRSESTPEEKGRSLPFRADNYVGLAVFQTIHQAIQPIAIWMCITGLLDLLMDPFLDKLHKATILQELSNMCNFEYTRTQHRLKSEISAGIASSWFETLPVVVDNVAYERRTMNGDPRELTRKDPQLHYLLTLCQNETSVLGAVEWIQRLKHLYVAHPLVREKLFEREARAVFDLVAVVSFVQDISLVFSLPSPSLNKGRLFVSRLQDVGMELNQVKEGIDLGHLVTHPTGLLKPNKAARVLKALDRYVTDKTGAKMGSLYEDKLEEMFQDLEEQYRRAKEKLGKDNEAVFIPVDTTLQDQNWRVESRRQKEKRRSSNVSVYSMSSLADALREDDSTPPAETVEVGLATAEVFNTLFDKSQSQRSLSWTAFEAAMAELGFTILPRFGSVYTFRPPATMLIQRSINIHRPHKSRIEGNQFHVLGRRLRRAYGWSKSSFETV